MSIDHFASRVWRILSMVAFGISLLFIYRGLPDPTAVHFGETGRGDGFLPKEEVFYLVAGIITLMNVLALLLIKAIDKIPTEKWSQILPVFAEKGTAQIGEYAGYKPLLLKIVDFFKTGFVPVSAVETLEICAFMEAADASKKLGGIPVSLDSMFSKASLKR